MKSYLTHLSSNSRRDWQARLQDSTSLRSRRKSLARWSERSERNPGFAMKMNYQARFSGRQRYGTARRSERVTHAANLPARYRERFCTAVILLLTVALAGCSRVHSVVHPGTDSPPSRSSPAQGGISSSADVVRVTTSPVTLTRNFTDATVTLSISPGYHINANPATFSYLIPTAVNPGKTEGIIAGSPVYPAGQKKKFQFAEEPLAVYEGAVQIKMPLRVATNITGPGRLPISVTVQACDHEKCYAPATLDATITVNVK